MTKPFRRLVAALAASSLAVLGLTSCAPSYPAATPITTEMVGLQRHAWSFDSIAAECPTLQDIGYDGQAECAIFCSDVSVKPDLYTSGCKKPFNQYSHLTFYLLFTPEFQMIVVLISSSLAQLVALWGMTSIRMRQAFSNNSLKMMLITPVESSPPVTH